MNGYKTETLKIKSSADGLELSVLFVMPEPANAQVGVQSVNGKKDDNDGQHGVKKCRGIVQIVHGMSEYKERYLPLMMFLAEHGLASVIHDHRGHGESVRDVRDYGYMYEAGTDAFLEDIRQVNGIARQKLPGLPLVMFGHSMGSLAARSLMRKYDREVDVLILSGAPCRNSAVDAAIFLAALQKRLYGGRHVANLLEKMSFLPYVKRFAHEKNKFAWICSDPWVVEAYDRDPRCGFTFTVDGFQTLFELMKRTYTLKGWKCSNPQLPILFLAGEEDPCIGSTAKFRKEIRYMERAGYIDVQGLQYKGMRHEICNEPDKKKVFEDVEGFLRRRDI